jgi:hypothetical protein
MEAARNLHTFHEFPVKAALHLAEWRRLWAGADGGARYRLRARIGFVLGQADAGTRAATTRAGDAPDLRDIGIGGRRREPLRRVRHHERRARRGEDVLLLTGIASGKGLGIRCMRRVRDDCCGRSYGDRDCESAGEEQASRCNRVSRHCQDCTNAESSLQTFSVFAGNVSAAHAKKLGHIAAPQPCFCCLVTGWS